LFDKRDNVLYRLNWLEIENFDLNFFTVNLPNSSPQGD